MAPCLWLVQIEWNKDKIWYLDIRASNYICGVKNIFVEPDGLVNDTLAFDNESKVEVKGKGNILIQLKNGEHQLISKVYYMSNMKINILSLAKS